MKEKWFSIWKKIEQWLDTWGEYPSHALTLAIITCLLAWLAIYLQILQERTVRAFLEILNKY